MTSHPALRFFGCVGVAAQFVACNPQDAQFQVQHAEGATLAPKTLSVFGVFKDGRMSSEAWEQLGAKLSAPFQAAPCDVAFGAEFLAKYSSVAGAVDDFTRANGVTDSLLGHLAGSAKGDAMLVFTVAGRLARPLAESTSGPPPPAAPMSSPGRMGALRGHGRLGERRAHDPNAYEISASVFSVPLRRSIVLVRMTYTGTSEAEALDHFTNKLRTELPGAGCTGWKMPLDVDEKALSELSSQ